jgi:methionyl-tRNA synthetase
MIIADILKRWQVLLGNDARLLTGTDEHGMKVEGSIHFRPAAY